MLISRNVNNQGSLVRRIITMHSQSETAGATFGGNYSGKQKKKTLLHTSKIHIVCKTWHNPFSRDGFYRAVLVVLWRQITPRSKYSPDTVAEPLFCGESDESAGKKRHEEDKIAKRSDNTGDDTETKMWTNKGLEISCQQSLTKAYRPNPTLDDCSCFCARRFWPWGYYNHGTTRKERMRE